VQRADGGWGEDEETYAHATPGTFTESTPSQTAWAVLGLMSAGRAHHLAVARGIAWLRTHQREDGEWQELPYTAVGFPRVFYLRYHGYKQFFPLLALSRYRNIKKSNDKRVQFGI
jgi:squalene-hopene/tetraprenyl-beta-curcumene cyclase